MNENVVSPRDKIFAGAADPRKNDLISEFCQGLPKFILNNNNLIQYNKYGAMSIISNPCK